MLAIAILSTILLTITPATAADETKGPSFEIVMAAVKAAQSAKTENLEGFLYKIGDLLGDLPSRDPETILNFRTTPFEMLPSLQKTSVFSPGKFQGGRFEITETQENFRVICRKEIYLKHSELKIALLKVRVRIRRKMRPDSFDDRRVEEAEEVRTARQDFENFERDAYSNGHCYAIKTVIELTESYTPRFTGDRIQKRHIRFALIGTDSDGRPFEKKIPILAEDSSRLSLTQCRGVISDACPVKPDLCEDVDTQKTGPATDKCLAQLTNRHQCLTKKLPELDPSEFIFLSDRECVRRYGEEPKYTNFRVSSLDQSGAGTLAGPETKKIEAK